METGSEKSSPKGGRPPPKNSFVGKVITAIAMIAIVCLLFGGRVSYAIAECSKGTKQCVVGVGVALGIVDVYDKNGHCTGDGCNF